MKNLIMSLYALLLICYVGVSGADFTIEWKPRNGADHSEHSMKILTTVECSPVRGGTANMCAPKKVTYQSVKSQEYSDHKNGGLRDPDEKLIKKTKRSFGIDCENINTLPNQGTYTSEPYSGGTSYAPSLLNVLYFSLLTNGASTVDTNTNYSLDIFPLGSTFTIGPITVQTLEDSQIAYTNIYTSHSVLWVVILHYDEENGYDVTNSPYTLPGQYTIMLTNQPVLEFGTFVLTEALGNSMSVYGLPDDFMGWFAKISDTDMRLLSHSTGSEPTSADPVLQLTKDFSTVLGSHHSQ